jgi:hypothetical protein
MRPYMWRSLNMFNFHNLNLKKKDKYNSTFIRFCNRKAYFHMLHFEINELRKAFTTLTDSGIPVCFIMGAAGRPDLISRTT